MPSLETTSAMPVSMCQSTACCAATTAAFCWFLPKFSCFGYGWLVQTRACTLFKRQAWSFGAAQPRPRCKVRRNPADAPAVPSAIGTAHQKALLELCRVTTPLSVAGLLLTPATLSAAHRTIVTANSDDPSEGCSISGVPPLARYAHAPREAHAQSAEHAQTA